MKPLAIYLWGDIPALMVIPAKAQKFNPDGTGHPVGSWFKVADSKNRGAQSGQKVTGYSDPRRNGGRGVHLTSQIENDEGLKLGGSWFHGYRKGQGPRNHGSKSSKRKAASAQIAKIPFPLAQYIAQCFKPDNLQEACA